MNEKSLIRTLIETTVVCTVGVPLAIVGMAMGNIAVEKIKARLNKDKESKVKTGEELDT